MTGGFRFYSITRIPHPNRLTAQLQYVRFNSAQSPAPDSDRAHPHFTHTPKILLFASVVAAGEIRQTLSPTFVSWIDLVVDVQ